MFLELHLDDVPLAVGLVGDVHKISDLIRVYALKNGLSY